MRINSGNYKNVLHGLALQLPRELCMFIGVDVNFPCSLSKLVTDKLSGLKFKCVSLLIRTLGDSTVYN